MGVKYSSYDQNYTSRLHRAVARSDIKTLKYLLDKEEDVNFVENEHHLLNIALRHRNNDIINLLIGAGCDVNGRPHCVMEPLRQAVLMGHVDYVKLLLQHGASVNMDGVLHTAPATRHPVLHSAASTRHANMPEIINLLISHGAEPNAVDEAGCTALVACIGINYLQLETRALIPHSHLNAQSGGTGRTALMEAIVRGNTEMAEAVVEAGCDVDISDNDGATPLMAAISNYSPQIVSLLLSKGAKQNIVDKNGMSALHIAAQCRDLHTMERLVAGADINIIDRMKRTPLTICTLMGSLDGVNLLLKHGANVDTSTIEGKTPMHIAANKGRLDIAEVLLHSGASISEEDKTGKTPLLIAASEDRRQVVQYLLASGAGLNHRDSMGRTALYLAAQQGHDATAQMLLKAGARMDLSDRSGNAPLHMSLRFPGLNLQLMWLLVQRGCDPLNLHHFLDWMIENEIVPRQTVFADKQLEEWYLRQKKNPDPLLHQCRMYLHKAMQIGPRDTPRHKMAQLPLPSGLIDYVSLKLL